MPVRIEFDTDSAAFENWGWLEIQNTIENVAKAIIDARTEPAFAGLVKDVNGNAIGRWSATLDVPVDIREPLE